MITALRIVVALAILGTGFNAMNAVYVWLHLRSSGASFAIVRMFHLELEFETYLIGSLVAFGFSLFVLMLLPSSNRDRTTETRAEP